SQTPDPAAEIWAAAVDRTACDPDRSADRRQPAERRRAWRPETGIRAAAAASRSLSSRPAGSTPGDPVQIGRQPAAQRNRDDLGQAVGMPLGDPRLDGLDAFGPGFDQKQPFPALLHL